MSASTVGKPIFYIKATEDKTRISIHMLYGSGRSSYPLVICMQVHIQKLAVVGLLLILVQGGQEVLIFKN